jgi:hypothetical protein
MPVFSKALDVYQGYNYKKDKTAPVGYITSLSLFQPAVALAVDTNCKDPTAPGTGLAVVSVLSDVHWATGVTDAVRFTGQLSPTNRATIANALYTTMDTVEVDFQFNIYMYDPVAQKYYMAFTSNGTAMTGILEKNGDELALRVSDDPDTRVQSPINYTFSIGIKPHATAQSLTLATASGATFQKQWGLTVASS